MLEALSLVETGDEVEPGTRSAPFSCCERPDGWVIVFSEDFDWASRERVRELSRFGLAVGCQFEDKVEMTSVACVADQGAELWCVGHANEPSRFLTVDGKPPAEFAAIRDRLLREKAEHGGEGAGADVMFDLPIELAKVVCGFRADEDEAMFLALRDVGLGRDDHPKGQTSLLDKLLAPFRRH